MYNSKLCFLPLILANYLVMSRIKSLQKHNSFMQIHDLFHIDDFLQVKKNLLKVSTYILQCVGDRHFYLVVDLLLLAMKQRMCFGLLFSQLHSLCVSVTQIDRLTTDLLPKAQLKN